MSKLLGFNFKKLAQILTIFGPKFLHLDKVLFEQKIYFLKYKYLRLVIQLSFYRFILKPMFQQPLPIGVTYVWDWTKEAYSKYEGGEVAEGFTKFSKKFS